MAAGGGPGEGPRPLLPREQGGHAIRYGVCDAGASTGFVNVGTGHNTAASAVEPVRRWRQREDAYPGAERLLITSDAGGNDGWKNRAWKTGLAVLARRRARKSRAATSRPAPPGTSKWNKIGHRLFSQITIAGRGRPLTSHDVIIDTIAAVTTRTGLTVTAVLDGARYPTGTQISDELMQDLEDRALTRHGFHGEWNYTLLPALRPAPEPQPEPAPPPAAAARAAVLPALAARS